jgi:hypothetical protein
MRFIGLGPTRGRMPAGGDGIVRETAPAAARLSSLSSANYFVGAAGAGGPDLAAGTTVLFRWWDTDPITDNFLAGYGDGASGWAIDVNASNVYIYLRNPGATSLIVTAQGRIRGLNSLALTRTAGGALRAAINGCVAQLVSAAPTYVSGAATAAEYIGRSAPGIGTYGSAGSGLIAQAYLTREASDAELQEWSRTDVLDCHHIHPTPLADAALALHRRAEDWDGSGASWACAVGSRTLTKTGSPVKTVIAARTRYAVPAWAYQDSAPTQDESLRQFGSRFRITTEATELSVVIKDNLAGSSASFVAYKEANLSEGGTAAGTGATNKDTLNCFGAGGTPVTVEGTGLTAGSKLVTITEGLRILSGAGPYGSVGYNVTHVSVPATTPAVFERPVAPGHRLLIIADSIGEQIQSAGGLPTRQAWTMLCRANRGAVTVDSVGSASYFSLAYQSAWRAASVARWVARLDGTANNTVWLALGTNDYGINPWAGSVANFTTCVAATLDDLHAAAPSAGIWMQLPITRGTEGTIETWRTAMRAVASTRAWANVFETISPALGDGVHPTIAGHVTYEAAVKVALGY